MEYRALPRVWTEITGNRREVYLHTFRGYLAGESTMHLFGRFLRRPARHLSVPLSSLAVVLRFRLKPCGSETGIKGGTQHNSRFHVVGENESGVMVWDMVPARALSRKQRQA